MWVRPDHPSWPLVWDGLVTTPHNSVNTPRRFQHANGEDMTEDQITTLVESVEKIAENLGYCAGGLNYYAGKPHHGPVGLEAIAMALGYKEEAIPRIATALERIADALETLASK